MRRKAKKALIYGLTGWCTEVAFTGLKAGLKGDRKLESHTYLWMLPIYALCAPLFEPIHDRMREAPVWARAGTYAAGFMAVEYATGWMLDKTIGVCPWDYSDRARFHIKGYVRLDYAPGWALAGLGAERLHDYLDQVLPRLEQTRD